MKRVNDSQAPKTKRTIHSIELIANSNGWAFNSAEAALTVRGMRLKSPFFSKTAADFISALASPTVQLNLTVNQMVWAAFCVH
jgi:hypothetical protein